MTKAVIFDCWYTLFYDDAKVPTAEKILNKVGGTLKDYNYVKIFEKSLMLKKYKEWETPLFNLVKEAGIKPNKKLIKELLGIITRGFEHSKPYPEVLEQLKILKQKYKICLLTNTYSLTFEKLKENYGLGDYFDVIIASYETGLLKPDPKVFDLALKKLKVSKEEVVMVGDSLKDDVQAAENYGIRAVLIDRKGRYPDYQNRITSLEHLKDFL